MKLENVVFYFPCTVTGGGQYLFIRYSESLAKEHPELNVFFVDYKDGFARREIGANPSIKFIDYEDGVKTIIPDNSIVVYTLNHLYHHRDYMTYNENNTTFLFWCIAFHDLAVRKYLVSSKLKRKIGELYVELTKLHTIKHLGQLAHFRIAYSFGVNPIETDYIPIVIPFDKYAHNQPHDLCNPIRFCWLGRLDYDKYNDIVTYMNELEVLNKKYPLTFSLIGLGPAEEKLRTLSKNYGFECIFVGEKRNEELADYIKNNTDIGLASGTSSLEFAMRGRPVIQMWKLDKVYGYAECDTFHFVGDKMDMTLSTPSCPVIQNQSKFSEKFEEIDRDYPAACRRAYKYSESRSPQATCENMYQTLMKISQLDIPSTNRMICNLADLLSEAKKEPMFVMKLRSLVKFIIKQYS